MSQHPVKSPSSLSLLATPSSSLLTGREAVSCWVCRLQSSVEQVRPSEDEMLFVCWMLELLLLLLPAATHCQSGDGDTETGEDKDWWDSHCWQVKLCSVTLGLFQKSTKIWKHHWQWIVGGLWVIADNLLNIWNIDSFIYSVSNHRNLKGHVFIEQLIGILFIIELLFWYLLNNHVLDFFK